jgi:hypothetical protein
MINLIIILMALVCMGLVWFFIDPKRRRIRDKGRMVANWKIRRFENEGEWRKNNPYNISEVKQNLLLNEGINELWTILCSSGGTKFDNTNANLGVGDSATAAQATDTGLLGTSKLYKSMDGGYPTYGTAQKATWRSTFQSGEANFAWNEFTVCNTALDTGDNLNRKVQSEGTKTAGQVWELTLEITLS